MAKQTAAEQRKHLVERFEMLTGEKAPAGAKNIDLLTWIRDEVGEQTRKGYVGAWTTYRPTVGIPVHAEPGSLAGRLLGLE